MKTKNVVKVWCVGLSLEEQTKAWWTIAEQHFPHAFARLTDTLSSQSSGKGIANRRKAAFKGLCRLMGGTPRLLPTWA